MCKDAHWCNLNPYTFAQEVGALHELIQSIRPLLMMRALASRGTHFEYYDETRSLGALRARLLAGGLLGLLTSYFAPFGCSGRVTHASVIG